MASGRARYEPPACDCDNAPFHLPHCARLGRRRYEPEPLARVGGIAGVAVLAVLAGLVLGYVLSKGLTWLVILWEAIGPRSLAR
jgi:hypothetical protein